MKPMKLFLILALTSMGVTAKQECPDDFHDIPMYPSARLCHVFDDKLPASISFHADADIEMTTSYYVQNLGSTSNRYMSRGRQILQFNNGQQVIIVSEDGAGSQVDILIKSTFTQ